MLTEDYIQNVQSLREYLIYVKTKCDSVENSQFSNKEKEDYLKHFLKGGK